MKGLSLDLGTAGTKEFDAIDEALLAHEVVFFRDQVSGGAVTFVFINMTLLVAFVCINITFLDTRSSFFATMSVLSRSLRSYISLNHSNKDSQSVLLRFFSHPGWLDARGPRGVRGALFRRA
jgi:hypothetical protein